MPGALVGGNANPSRSAGMWPPSLGSWITCQVALGVAGQHLGPIHRREEAGDESSGARGEGVRHHVVGVGPDAEVRVVAEVAPGTAKA